MSRLSRRTEYTGTTLSVVLYGGQQKLVPFVTYVAVVGTERAIALIDAVKRSIT